MLNFKIFGYILIECLEKLNRKSKCELLSWETRYDISILDNIIDSAYGPTPFQELAIQSKMNYFISSVFLISTSNYSSGKDFTKLIL